jgi:peptide deformylase
MARMIITTENPAHLNVLRQRSAAVPEPDSQEIQDLIVEMLAAMMFNGVGLSAVQLGVLKRVIVVELSSATDIRLRWNKFHMVNPEILWLSEETEEAVEGCLSILDPMRGREKEEKEGYPDLLKLPVRRSLRIVVRYDDPYAKETVEMGFFGYSARIVQHEMDHLDGKLIIDHQNNKALAA